MDSFAGHKRPSGSRFVTCPVCGATVPAFDINCHLDSVICTGSKHLGSKRIPERTIKQSRHEQLAQGRHAGTKSANVTSHDVCDVWSTTSHPGIPVSALQLRSATVKTGIKENCREIASRLSPVHEAPSSASAFQLLRRPPLAFVQQADCRKHAVSDSDLWRHVPCELVRNALPKALATKLLHVMLGDSKGWDQPTWFLFGQEHAAPRKSKYFDLSDEQELRGLCNNSGNADASANVSCAAAGGMLREAAALISAHVNRLSSPWPIDDADRAGWAPTYCFGNLYRDGQDSTGAHADRLTLLGIRPVIASLSLGATRLFRMRRAKVEDGAGALAVAQDRKHAANQRKAATMPATDITLEHNSLLIMMPPAQEAYKHEVPRTATKIASHPDAGLQRVNLTFRRLKPEFEAHVPRCKCGNRAILKAHYTTKDLAPRTYPEDQRFYFACDNTQSHGCGFHMPYAMSCHDEDI